MVAPCAAESDGYGRRYRGIAIVTMRLRNECITMGNCCPVDMSSFLRAVRFPHRVNPNDVNMFGICRWGPSFFVLFPYGFCMGRLADGGYTRGIAHRTGQSAANIRLRKKARRRHLRILAPSSRKRFRRIGAIRLIAGRTCKSRATRRKYARSAFEMERNRCRIERTTMAVTARFI